ncbi:hypothetical protein ACQPWW_23235 [Micromonospora sp. CA-240977]|uniref:hypothetical protein n=1 Tax=Micromonospora sp. CA-240977 TaxID=3239957 RepID=UPI003D9005C5
MAAFTIRLILYAPLTCNVDSHEVVRQTVGGLISIAYLLPKARGRCGLYESAFADGQRYVRQAVDAVARFCAHRRTWSVIVEIALVDVALAAWNRLSSDP